MMLLFVEWYHLLVVKIRRLTLQHYNMHGTKDTTTCNHDNMTPSRAWSEAEQYMGVQLYTNILGKVLYIYVQFTFRAICIK